MSDSPSGGVTRRRNWPDPARSNEKRAAPNANVLSVRAMSGSGGIAAVSTGIAEALVTTALGLFVAIPAVWLFNIFTNKIERFQVEMSNSASELIDYFIKRRGAGVNLSMRAS